MPAAGEQFLLLNDFSGGLNLKDSPHFLRPNEAAECRNLIFERTGEATVRRGYVLWGDTGTGQPVRGMHRFYGPMGPQLLVTSGGSIWLGDDSSGMFTEVASDLQDEPMGAVTWGWKNVAFFGNGIDDILVWNGGQMEALQNAPKGRFLAVHGNRLFVAGDSDSPTTLYWSELGDYETWPAFNYAEADENITGIVSDYGRLFVFTPSRIQVFIGDGGLTTTHGIQTLLDGVGCVAPGSIATWEGKTIFLAHDGVRVFDGSASVIISRNIEPVIRNQTPQQRRDVTAAVHKGRYWLRWCDPTNRCIIYVYDLAGGWWTEFRGISASYLLSLSGVEEADGLLSGDWQGRVYRQDTGDTDDGKPIVSSWKSKVFTLAPGMALQYRRVSVEIQRMQGPMHVDWFTRSGARTGTITLEPAPTGTVWGQFVWGQEPWSQNRPAVRRAPLPRGAVGQTVQLGIRQHGRGVWSNLTLQLWPKRRAR